MTAEDKGLERFRVLTTSFCIWLLVLLLWALCFVQSWLGSASWVKKNFQWKRLGISNFYPKTCHWWLEHITRYSRYRGALPPMGEWPSEEKYGIIIRAIGEDIWESGRITESTGWGCLCDASGVSDPALWALSIPGAWVLFSCSDIVGIATTLLWPLHFLSCVCQTFSRSRQQKPPRSEGAELAEVGGDAKALRRGSGQKKTECSLMRACSTLMPVRVLPVCSFVAFSILLFPLLEFLFIKAFIRRSWSLENWEKQSNFEAFNTLPW